MINVASNKLIVGDSDTNSEDPFIVDKDTGIKRPKQILQPEKPKGVVPKLTMNSYSDIKNIKLEPKDWFLTQSTIMSTLPIGEDNLIPEELMPYINSNFNTYPNSSLPDYLDDFKGALLLKNHIPNLAYGFVIDVKPRAVKVGEHTLNYVDILTAVNRNIDPQFAEDIRTKKIKFMSWGHTLGKSHCAVCGDDTFDCPHIFKMMIKDTPKPAISGGRPYGILHRHDSDFHVYDVSYLDVKPAYDGALSNQITELDKPLVVPVSLSNIIQKAKWASEGEDIKHTDIVNRLIKELKLI